MTCIIGAYCKEGAVMVSDRYVIKGDEIYQEDKIINYGDYFCIGYAGLSGIQDKFNALIEEGLQEIRPRTLEDIIVALETGIKKIYDTYLPRFGNRERVLMEGIIVGLKNFDKGQAEIYTLHQIGYAEKATNFTCIGSGGYHASSLLKLLYRENMPAETLLKICGFIILLIEGMGIDRNVGGTPQGIILRNNERVEVISSDEMEKKLKNLSKEEIFEECKKGFYDIINKLGLIEK
jgi:20S proteasome alpha/beta subunit